MENFSDTSGFMVSWEENETEGEDYPEDGFEDEESVEPTAPNLPGQAIISFTEEEQVLNSNEEVEQTTNNFDLNKSTEYPGIDGFGDHQDYSNMTTAFENTEAFTYGLQNPARTDFQSEWQRPQTDNTYGPYHGGPDPYKEGNDGKQGDITYFGMDNRWHTYRPTQGLQAGIPHLAGNNRRALSHQQPSEYPASSYAAGPLLPGNSWDVGAGSPLAYLHPANAQVSQQTQQQNTHTASTQVAFQASGNSTSMPVKPLSGTNRPKRRTASAPSEQPPSSSSESFSAPAPQHLFTAEDFLPKCRKGGKLMDDGMTWNKETEQNHYDQFARKYGLPAVPQAVKGGPSRFKLRSNAVDALTQNQKQMLQNFINAAKYFALTGEPNRPGNHQTAINLESDEDGSEMDSANRPGKYRTIASKKGSRGEADETDEALPKTRMRNNPNSTIRRGNLQPKSKPSVKNPQGEMTFSNMDAANQWLASLGQPSILEAANTLLSHRGIPSIQIASPRLAGLSSNFGYQPGNSAPQVAVNDYSTGVQRPGFDGNTRNSGLPSSKSSKRKARTDSEQHADAVHREDSRAKRPRTENTGMTSSQSSNQGTPRRHQAQPNSRRGPQQQQGVPTVHKKAQIHNSPVAEGSSLSYAVAETSRPNIYGRGASVDSGYRSTISGNANDVNDPSQYAPIASNQSQYSDLIPNQNLSQTSAPPSNHGSQPSMENCQTGQSANDGLAGEGHENDQALDSNFSSVEHQNREDFDFVPASVEQDSLADFDFGSSSLGDSYSSRNTMPALQHNENASENNVSVPQTDDEFDWQNEIFYFESFQKTHSSSKSITKGSSL